MRKKIEKSDTRLPNTFRQTEPGIRAYTVDDIIYVLMPTQTLILALCIVFYMVSALCIMSTWALQFVPVSEVEIPMAVTGSAIGVISMFSFVSDIFYSAVCGHFIDTYGLGGYKWIFVMTVVVLLAGAAACMYIVKKIKARSAKTL